ncbi:NADH-quinone oxidoreductase subunit M [Candidatus Poribacteria bacterium]|nr:NADH-quinone oxidoreductase subunit M [Candidatus Poribacteria bacterium]
MDVLTLLWLVPLVAMVVVLVAPRSLARIISLIATAITLVLSGVVWSSFDPSVASIQMETRLAWIPALNIQYFVGVDGISITLILLTTVISIIAVIASWNIGEETHREGTEKGYFAMLLLLVSGMLGFFLALDLILFYLFFELTLLPMYFLIGVWGGPRREYAAIKFFLYTLFGSVFMLVAILALYFQSGAAGARTFSIPELAQAGLPVHVLNWLWLGFFLGFAIKVPIFPFHTWLPDAHVEAPTPISVILAGVLLKMGTYGLVRMNVQVLSGASEGWWTFLAVLGVINIIYGSFCAMAQKDLKKLVAYSSIGHMGFVLLATAARTPEGINGAIFQMVSHGLLSGMLFLVVGVIYVRAHHRYIVYPTETELLDLYHIDRSKAGTMGFGGLANIMPVYTGVMTIAFFGSLGLPGMSGFVGEALALLGAWRVYPVFTVLAVIGIVVGAAYFLWTIQRMFLGAKNPDWAGLPDISTRELVTLVPLAALVIVLGVVPRIAIDLTKETVVGLQAVQDAVARLTSF